MENPDLPFEMVFALYQALQKAKAEGEPIDLLFEAVRRDGPLAVQWAQDHMLLIFTVPEQTHPYPEASPRCIPPDPEC